MFSQNVQVLDLSVLLLYFKKNSRNFTIFFINIFLKKSLFSFSRASRSGNPLTPNQCHIVFLYCLHETNIFFLDVSIPHILLIYLIWKSAFCFPICPHTWYNIAVFICFYVCCSKVNASQVQVSRLVMNFRCSLAPQRRLPLYRPCWEKLY